MDEPRIHLDLSIDEARWLTYDSVKRRAEDAAYLVLSPDRGPEWTGSKDEWAAEMAKKIGESFAMGWDDYVSDQMVRPDG